MRDTSAVSKTVVRLIGVPRVRISPPPLGRANLSAGGRFLALAARRGGTPVCRSRPLEAARGGRRLSRTTGHQTRCGWSLPTTACPTWRRSSARTGPGCASRRSRGQRASVRSRPATWSSIGEWRGRGGAGGGPARLYMRSDGGLCLFRRVDADRVVECFGLALESAGLRSVAARPVTSWPVRSRGCFRKRGR
jgi:hypothetical protein